MKSKTQSRLLSLMEQIIVIGGGLMGTSAAWQLSKYGEKVLLLEQQSETYVEGSSTGASRITRSLGPKKDIFAFLQRKTIEESKKLLHFLNGINLSKQHKMKDIYTTAPVTYLFHKNQEEELQSFRYKKQKVKFKKAAGDLAFRKFGITPNKNQVVVQEYKKYAGTFNPQALIKKLRLGIKKKHNRIAFHQKVVSIKREHDCYTLKVLNTKTGDVKILQTKKVVIAVGPYTVSLLKKLAPYFRKLMIPKKVALCFFKINPNRYKRLTTKEKKQLFKSFPIFDQNDEMFFSMIENIDKEGNPLFKAGGHHLQGNIQDLEGIWKLKTTNKEIKWTKKAFKRYIDMLEIPIRKKDIDFVKQSTCVYSNTPNKIPFVTHLLTKDKKIDKQAVVIGGMSGTGAKGCLAYGLIAADLLLNVDDKEKMYRKTKEQLSRNYIKRFK